MSNDPKGKGGASALPPVKPPTKTAPTTLQPDQHGLDGPVRVGNWLVTPYPKNQDGSQDVKIELIIPEGSLVALVADRVPIRKEFIR